MINFGGLATGIDTQSLISGLMAAERIPLQRLQSKQKDLTGAKDKLSDILSKFSEVGKAAKELSDATGFGSFAAESSSEGLIATASTPQGEGSFSLVVNQMAKAQRSHSNGMASSTGALGQSGTMSITVGGDAQIDITVDATDSLTDVAAKINASGARTNASVVFDGTDYHLMVQGTDTGAQNAVTFSGLTMGLDANTLTAAQDAEIVLEVADETADRRCRQPEVARRRSKALKIGDAIKRSDRGEKVHSIIPFFRIIYPKKIVLSNNSGQPIFLGMNNAGHGSTLNSRH